jgi:Ca2+-binding RTX toxin-like protein
MMVLGAIASIVALLTLPFGGETAPLIQRPDCTIMGTAGDDEDLRGTPEPDVICGFGGRDQIFARQGADVVYGGRGRDQLFGGRGDDTIIGRGGLDLHSGQGGRDCLAAEERTRRDRGDVVRGGLGRRDHYSADPGDLIFTAEVPNLRC